MFRIAKQAMVLAGLALCPALVFATATVSGNLQDAGGSAVSSRTFVRFWLRGCANNQPRVNGVALIVPPGGPGYYKDYAPDAAGAISGSIYKNSEIECNGATGNTWYGVQVYRDGKPGPETPYSVVGATFNLNTATPTAQNPPPPPATFPYIMANPVAVQTISNFPLIFGSGSGIGANYQGAVRAAGTYLRSDGSSFFAPVSSAQITNDIVASPNLNGLVYWTGSGLSTTSTGGAGTLCLVSSNGGVPAFSSCAGSASTAWSALSAPSTHLILDTGGNRTLLSASSAWGLGGGSAVFGVTTAGSVGLAGDFVMSAVSGFGSLADPLFVGVNSGAVAFWVKRSGAATSGESNVVFGSRTPLSYRLGSTVTGTTANSLVKLVNTEVQTVTTADTSGKVIGICVDACGSQTTSIVAVAGIAPCTFENSGNPGDWVIVGTTIAGNCRSNGTSVPATTLTIVGRLVSGVIAGNIQGVLLQVAR